MKKRALTAIGDINLDMIIRYRKNGMEDSIEDYVLTCGGSTLNSAIILANSGIEIDFYGNIGNNFPIRFSKELKRIFRKFIVKKTKKKNGLVVSLSGKEDRKLLSYRGGNSEEIIVPNEKTDLLLLSSYYFQEHDFPNWQDYKNRVLGIGDSNINLEPELLERFDFIFMNEAHYERLKDLKVLKPKEVIVTLGNKGCLVISNGKEYFQKQTEKIEPVDSTGAGDAFLAGYLYGRLINGLSIEESTKLGNKSGAIATSILGTGLLFKKKEFDLSKFVQLNKKILQ